MQENTKIYTKGEIHFSDETIIPLKYAMVNNKVALIETSDDTYKLILKPLTVQDFDIKTPSRYSFLRPICYPSYKCNDEFKEWDPSNIEYIRCEE